MINQLEVAKSKPIEVKCIMELACVKKMRYQFPMHANRDFQKICFQAKLSG